MGNITIEEINLLDSILKFIPSKESFVVSDIYAINVLQPKFRKTDSTIDLIKYDPERNKFLASDIYKKVSTFLIAEYFAVNATVHAPVQAIVLTKKGQYLKAFGSFNAFYSATSESTTSEIEIRISSLIGFIPYHGEFILEPQPIKMTVVDFSDFLTVSDEVALKRVTKANEQEDELKSEYINLKRDEEVLQYLVNNGYAINRHDINNDRGIYRQLTDKGRELKDVGTILAYRKLSEKKEEKILQDEMQRDIERQRNKYLFRINLWGL
ncbi:MAG: hypothetical protein JWQ84_1890 [Mucilaginibacter sp.]|nr:hypothetical protein [Mucilaginibacter sp.]